MSKFVVRFLNSESGATALEYGLIATGIAVVIASVVGVIGGHMKEPYQDAADIFTNK